MRWRSSRTSSCATPVASSRTTCGAPGQDGFGPAVHFTKEFSPWSLLGDAVTTVIMQTSPSPSHGFARPSLSPRGEGCQIEPGLVGSLSPGGRGIRRTAEPRMPSDHIADQTACRPIERREPRFRGRVLRLDDGAGAARPLSGGAGDHRAVRDEHLPADVVVRAQLLPLPGQPAGAARFRLVPQLREDPDRRHGLGAVPDDRRHRRLERAVAAGRRLPAGAAVREGIPAAPHPADAGADPDDAVLRGGRGVLQAVLRADLRPAEPDHRHAFTGEPFVLLSTPAGARIGIIVADAWMWSPFVMLLVLAGLVSVPKYLYEAAEIDRASWWRRSPPSPSPISAACCCWRSCSAPSRPSSCSTWST